MKLTSILMILVGCLIVCCNITSETNRQLARADSLLCHNYVDSAASILKNIVFHTKEDSAYYFILKSEIFYRRGDSIDLNEVNYSIKYYLQNRDNRKLAVAYYYKVCAYFTKDTFPAECFVLLKEAEQAAGNTSDINLKSKICSALTYANHAKNQIGEALKYSKKEYYYAQILNDRRDIAYSLIRVALCYKHIGNKDSAEFYIKKCRMLVDEVNDGDKSYVYNLLGECSMDDDLDTALHYFRSALIYKKLPESFHNIAKIYREKNDIANWQVYCDSALSNAWYYEKLDILSDIAQNYYTDGDIASYKKATDMTLETWKDFMSFEKKNYALEIQRKFDFEKQQTEYEKNIFICVSAIVFLTALCIILHQKRKQEKQAAIQKELEIENHNLQLFNELCELKIKLGNFEQNIQDLKTENLKLSEQQYSEEYNATKQQIMEVLAKGQSIYQKITDNVCIVDESEYWIYCIFYFKTNHPQMANLVFNNYHKLNTEEKMFVIIDDSFKKKDTDIASILDISPTTVRTRRTKMKKKLS